MTLIKSKFLVAAILFFSSSAFAAETPVAPVLPQQFAVWKASGLVKTSKDPAVADPVNADLLKEYGFTDFASATYTSDDGRKLQIKAARFADASGAYGAFTYYKMPQMLTEKIGDQGSSLNNRVLFYRGSILVDAVFQELNAMSAAELRELAAELPLPPGNALILPNLPTYLPKQFYVKNSAKYVVGPAGLQKISAPIPAQLVDFSTGAEVVLGNYHTSDGEATLMLISYPTPQIATQHLKLIDAARQPDAGQKSGLAILADAGPLFDKRTGPLVVIAAGAISQSEAKSLLGAVNYEATVTWNENTFFDKKNNLGTLILNVLVLCGILMVFALVSGVAFGGARILLKRMFPNRVFDRPEQMEFISLHLSEGQTQAANSDVSSTNKAG